jgi:bifunctional non-homologous end joining protein LigD
MFSIGSSLGPAGGSGTAAVDGGRRTRDFQPCQDWPTLLWLANFGCIELIPWGSRVGSLDRPDYMVIDLDPQDAPFTETVQAALAVRRVLDKIGPEGVCKTSGKRRLHVYVPMSKQYTFGQAKMLAELVALLVNRALPATTSLDPRMERRKNRIYLDTIRNARGGGRSAVFSKAASGRDRVDPVEGV